MYGVLISAAILISALWAEKLVSPEKRKVLWGLLLWAVFFGIVGARLYHVVDYWQYYATNLASVLFVWQGGLGIFGALAGGVAGAALYLKVSCRGESFLYWLNLSGLFLPLGQAIGRWGNFFNQELYGGPTTLPWGVYIRPENRLIGYEGVENFHPLFFYESILNFLLFIFLFRRYTKKTRENTFLIYLIGYATIRFLLEFLRINPWTVYGINVAQAVCLISATLAVILLRFAKNTVTMTKDNGISY